MLESLERAVNRQAWGQQEELLASLVEVTHALLVAFLHANTDQQHKHQIPPPLSIPRPGDAAKPKRSWMELAMAMTARGG